jgi:hypothetical protein
MRSIARALGRPVPQPDRAANACTTTARTETGTADKDF